MELQIQLFLQFFFLIYIPMTKLNLYIHHGKRATKITNKTRHSVYYKKGYVTVIVLSKNLSPLLYYSDIFRLWVTNFPQSKTVAKRAVGLPGCVHIYTYTFPARRLEHATMQLCKF